MDSMIETQEELYQKILPVLTLRKKNLHQEGFTKIKEKDIFESLKQKKWQFEKNLSISSVVNDIIHIESSFFLDE